MSPTQVRVGSMSDPDDVAGLAHFTGVIEYNPLLHNRRAFCRKGNTSSGRLLMMRRPSLGAYSRRGGPLAS